MDFLIDNDIIIDLSNYDLCDEMMSALGTDRKKTYVHPDARYSLGILGRRSATAPRDYGAAVYDRMKSFMMGIQTVIPIYDNQYETMVGLDNVDIGEATLFAAVCDPDFLIATGDKRSLAAISSCSDCQPTVSRISGHVICLEQIILKLIEFKTFDYIKHKILHARRLDTALRAIFGSGMDSTEENVKDGLKSYIDDLRKITGNLLIPFPESE